jgi:hypothetical protein
LSARAFIASLQDRGATLEADGGRLVVTPAAALTDGDRRAWKAHKREILRALSASTASSTCSKIKRVALAAPTDAQWEAMSAESYAAAELLRRRLVADSVIFKVTDRAGALRFHSERLCVEWQKLAPDDWRAIMELRAELQHMMSARESVAGFSVGEAYQPDEALREVRETLEKQQREP